MEKQKYHNCIDTLLKESQSLRFINFNLISIMKKTTLFSALLAGSILLAGCGTPNQQSQQGAIGNILGNIATGVLTGQDPNSAATGAITNGSAISSIIGILTNGLGSSNSVSSIYGTWVYSEPAIQFESENALAQLGSSVINNIAQNKLAPYYQKIGITPGKFSVTFNEDNTCAYTMNGRQFTGTYSYDAKSKKVNIKGSIINLPTCYVTLSSSELALTYDSSKVLSIAQSIGMNSGNSTLGSIADLSSTYKGMKTGFLFKKK